MNRRANHMMLPEFELLTPQTLTEALVLLAAQGATLAPVSGGTNLIVDLRGGRHRPNVLMDISRLDALRGIRRENGHVVIGANSTIADLLTDSLIARHAVALKEAAAVFANPLVRNRATVGGNLADASPAADTAPPLLVLDAEVELVSQNGTRFVPLSEFLVAVRKTLRQPHELVASIRLPIPLGNDDLNRHYQGFAKLGLRKADAIAVVSVAVMVEGGGNGRCRAARIALGAVAPRPLRAFAAEEHLRGQMLTPRIIAAAARLAVEASSPIDDIRGSAAYRRRMVEVLARRLLTKAADGLSRNVT